jgi:hypothetical protein
LLLICLFYCGVLGVVYIFCTQILSGEKCIANMLTQTFLFLGGEVLGFEVRVSCLLGRCSYHLSYFFLMGFFHTSPSSCRAPHTSVGVWVLLVP